LKKIEKKAANVDTVDVTAAELKSVSGVQSGVVYNKYEEKRTFNFKTDTLGPNDDIYDIDKKFKKEKYYLMNKGFAERQMGLQKLREHKYNVIQNSVMSGSGAKPDCAPHDTWFLNKNHFVKSDEEIAKHSEMKMRGEKPNSEQHLATLKEMYGDDFMAD